MAATAGSRRSTATRVGLPGDPKSCVHCACESESCSIVQLQPGCARPEFALPSSAKSLFAAWFVHALQEQPAGLHLPPDVVSLKTAREPSGGSVWAIVPSVVVGGCEPRSSPLPLPHADGSAARATSPPARRRNALRVSRSPVAGLLGAGRSESGRRPRGPERRF
jgi:hypothetical protein